MTQEMSPTNDELELAMTTLEKWQKRETSNNNHNLATKISDVIEEIKDAMVEHTITIQICGKVSLRVGDCIAVVGKSGVYRVTDVLGKLKNVTIRYPPTP